MRPRSSVSVAALLSAALWVGCTGVNEAGDPPPEPNGGPEPAAEQLPEPDVRRVAAPTLTPEQQARQKEVDQLLLSRYQPYRILKTTQGYSGDIIDWIDSDSIPGPHLAPPKAPWSDEDLRLPYGVELGQPEIVQYPELRGPADTTPFHRPDFSVYVMGLTSATSLQDYIEHYQFVGQPADQNRLYAGFLATTAAKGVAGTISQFGGLVETGTFTLIEVAASCFGTNPLVTLELVGGVISRDMANFYDPLPKLQVEFLTRGVSTGNEIGGWEGRVTGFRPMLNRSYGPGAVVPVSTPGGPTYEHRFYVSQDGVGNWWIAHNGNWLGYYPVHLFDLMNLFACQLGWYGEVFDPTPTDWTWTDMGSGKLDTAGYGYASYIRNPTYTNLLGASIWPDSIVVPMTPTVPACYGRGSYSAGQTPWDRYFYLGGPGGDAPGCE